MCKFSVKGPRPNRFMVRGSGKSQPPTLLNLMGHILPGLQRPAPGIGGDPKGTEFSNPTSFPGLEGPSDLGTPDWATGSTVALDTICQWDTKADEGTVETHSIFMEEATHSKAARCPGLKRDGH